MGYPSLPKKNHNHSRRKNLPVFLLESYAQKCSNNYCNCRLFVNHDDKRPKKIDCFKTGPKNRPFQNGPQKRMFQNRSLFQVYCQCFLTPHSIIFYCVSSTKIASKMLYVLQI